MPVGFIIEYPINVPNDLSTSMILNDGEFVIANISRSVDIAMGLPSSSKELRPTPPRRKDALVKVTYTAQDICNKEEFKVFYIQNLGRSVKMDFEGHTYYGYLSELSIGEYDITFNYSYTSKIEHIEEEGGLLSR